MWQIERTNVWTFLVDLANKETNRIRDYVKSKLFFLKKKKWYRCPFLLSKQIVSCEVSSSVPRARLSRSYANSFVVTHFESAHCLILVRGIQRGIFYQLHSLIFSRLDLSAEYFNDKKTLAKKSYLSNLLAASLFENHSWTQKRQFLLLRKQKTSNFPMLQKFKATA